MAPADAWQGPNLHIAAAGAVEFQPAWKITSWGSLEALRGHQWLLNSGCPRCQAAKRCANVLAPLYPKEIPVGHCCSHQPIPSGSCGSSWWLMVHLFNLVDCGQPHSNYYALCALTRKQHTDWIRMTGSMYRCHLTPPGTLGNLNPSRMNKDLLFSSFLYGSPGRPDFLNMGSSHLPALIISPSNDETGSNWTPGDD